MTAAATRIKAALHQHVPNLAARLGLEETTVAQTLQSALEPLKMSKHRTTMHRKIPLRIKENSDRIEARRKVAVWLA